MLRVAGELADGTITVWATPAGLADHVVPAITRAAGGGEPRVVASTFVCVTSEEDDRRAWVAEHFGMAGQVPSYRAMLERGHAAGSQDTIIVGDETVVERQIRQLFDAGATDLVAMLLGPGDEQARTTGLLADLAV